MNSNLILAAAIGTVLGGGYALLASHHYDRGYAAYRAEIAAEVAEVNARREELAQDLARERLSSGLAIRDAVEAALATLERETPEHAPQPDEARSAPAPPACPPAPRPACGLGPATLSKLNSIR